MRRGTVKSYSQQSQYGFAIADELGADCFFHRLDLVDGRPVQTGDEVEFEVVVCDRGLRASGVRVVQRGVGRCEEALCELVALAKQNSAT